MVGSYLDGRGLIVYVDRGQYQMRLIFSTTSKILLVGQLIVYPIGDDPRSLYMWSLMACGDPIYLVLSICDRRSPQVGLFLIAHVLT